MIMKLDTFDSCVFPQIFQDAKTLASKLPNVVDFHYVPNQHFTHLDFTYAKDTRGLVYNHILQVLNNTENSLRIDIKKKKR